MYDILAPPQVLLLTDDADNRRKAGELGIAAVSSLEYAKQRAADAPELADLVTAAAAREAAAGAAERREGPGGEDGGGGGGRAAKKRRVYEEHKPMSEITAGIKEGRFHQVRGPAWRLPGVWVGIPLEECAACLWLVDKSG